MLNVGLPSVTSKGFMQSFIMLNVVMLSVIMLNVVMLSVIMLNVAAPRLGWKSWAGTNTITYYKHS